MYPGAHQRLVSAEALAPFEPSNNCCFGEVVEIGVLVGRVVRDILEP